MPKVLTDKIKHSFVNLDKDIQTQIMKNSLKKKWKLDEAFCLRKCTIKILGEGGKGGDPFTTPSLRTTFAFTHPYFKKILERLHNDPPPLQASFTATPSSHPPPLPPPSKTFDHTLSIAQTLTSFNTKLSF